MRLPSVKTLSRIFGNDAKEARAILEGKSDPLKYETVKAWHDSCFHKPMNYALKLLALNELGDFYGVEPMWAVDDVKWPTGEYLNSGDCYTETLVRINGNYRVTCIGDIVERNPNKWR